MRFRIKILMYGKEGVKWEVHGVLRPSWIVWPLLVNRFIAACLKASSFPKLIWPGITTYGCHFDLTKTEEHLERCRKWGTKQPARARLIMQDAEPFYPTWWGFTAVEAPAFLGPFTAPVTWPQLQAYLFHGEIMTSWNENQAQNPPL